MSLSEADKKKWQDPIYREKILLILNERNKKRFLVLKINKFGIVG